MTLRNLVFCSIQSRTTTNTLRVQEYTIASSNAYIWFLKFSLHILEHERVLCFIECLRFWVVWWFGLIGFPSHMGSILRSIYADYRSLLFDKPPSQSFLGLRNALLREGTREEALRTSLWTTFCLAQFNEGRHCNYQPTKLYLIKNILVIYTIFTILVSWKRCFLIRGFH